jgi:hypothetical protein
MQYAMRQKNIPRNARATKAWDEKVYPLLSEGHPGLYGAATARARPQVARLAMIYCLLDRKPRVEIRHLKAALSVWKYCSASARHVFGDSLGEPADKLLSMLEEAGDEGMSKTEIRDATNRHRSDEVSAALELLQKYGRARREIVRKTGGRHKEWWWCT